MDKASLLEAAGKLPMVSTFCLHLWYFKEASILKDQRLMWIVELIMVKHL